MAVKFDSRGSSSTYSPQAGVVSNTTRTSARKFHSNSQVDNGNGGEGAVVSNSEHIVRQAIGLRSSAIAADGIASEARRALQLTRDLISQRKGPGSTPIVSADDVRNIQQNMAARVDQSTSGRLGGLQSLLTDSVSGMIFVTPAGLLSSPTTTGKSFSLVNTSAPRVDSVQVEFKKKKGVVDGFFCRITFSLPRSAIVADRVRAVRIFRSKSKGSITDRVISSRALETISSDRIANRNKGSGSPAALGLRLDEGGTKTALGVVNSIDPFTGLRNSFSAQSIVARTSPNGVSSTTISKNREFLSSYVDSEALAHLDPSVVRDNKFLANIKVQNSNLSVPLPGDQFRLGGQRIDGVSSLQIGQLSPGTSGGAAVARNNQADFREIAFLSPSKLEGRTIGGDVEYTYDDPTVLFGDSYSYFLVSVDSDMVESVRSRIVSTSVDGKRIPGYPDQFFASVMDGITTLSISVDDTLVEKFEVWRKEEGGGTPREISFIPSVISTVDGLNVSRKQVGIQKNGYMLIGECSNRGRLGTTLGDKSVRPGVLYSYRAYSVDVFGNKSERPAEVKIFVPDPRSRSVDLRRPTITAQYDSRSGVIVHIDCDDPRVENFFLARRDLTVGQKVFVPPGEVSHIRWGYGNKAEGQRKFEGEHLVDSDPSVSWTGVLRKDRGRIEFIDRHVSYDHTYQYQVCGIDRFGNRTSYQLSRNVFITRRSSIDPPVSLTGLVAAASGSVLGIFLSWKNGTVDIPAEALVGDRSVLQDNSVKTLYQVSRRTVGEDTWDLFPLTDQTTFFDQISNGSQVPQFRPSFVEMGREYVYRVEAVQSGGFTSIASAPLAVAVTLPVLPPADFFVEPSKEKVLPLAANLSWRTDPGSGVVDRWELERAPVNMFFSAQLSSIPGASIDSLPWKNFRTIYRESSRATSEALDSLSTRFDHGFVDTLVAAGNTYYYRIRAVSPWGDASDWAYGGLSAYSETFGARKDSLVTPEAAGVLAKSPIPLAPSLSAKAGSSKLVSSESIQPKFSSVFGDM